MRALLLASRIDTKGLGPSDLTTGDPSMMQAGARGRAFVFRDGAVALLEASAEEEAACIGGLHERLRDPLPAPASEEAQLVIREDAEEQVLPDGVIGLKNLDQARLIVVAEVLAKAAALNYFEPIVGRALGRAEALAAELSREGRTSADLLQLGKRMGEALLVEHRLVGRAAIAEKPDLLWDYPALERLYGRLEAEYELRERSLVLERKLEVLRTTAVFITELVQNRRAQLLEWAIIALIVFEIALSIYTAITGR